MSASSSLNQNKLTLNDCKNLETTYIQLSEGVKREFGRHILTSGDDVAKYADEGGKALCMEGAAHLIANIAEIEAKFSSSTGEILSSLHASSLPELNSATDSLIEKSAEIIRQNQELEKQAESLIETMRSRQQ